MVISPSPPRGEGAREPLHRNLLRVFQRYWLQASLSILNRNSSFLARCLGPHDWPALAVDSLWGSRRAGNHAGCAKPLDSIDPADNEGREGHRERLVTECHTLSVFALRPRRTKAISADQTQRWEARPALFPRSQNVPGQRWRLRTGAIKGMRTDGTKPPDDLALCRWR